MENVNISAVCGLCLGCETAINKATNAAKLGSTTLFKEIVHNKNVNAKLFNLGIGTVNNFDEIDKNSTLIIRAHGEPPQTYDYLNKNKIKYVDGTCKNVDAIHQDVLKFSQDGFLVVIIGKYGKNGKDCHPEVFGTIGWCRGEPVLMEDLEDVNKLNSIFDKKIFVICQTTFNPDKFEQMKIKIDEVCTKNNNKLIIKNTICGAQRAIQNASRLLAKNSDIMIVVGGKNSSNSIELFNNISKICKAVFIENINDWKAALDELDFKISKNTKIGLTAGASTDKEELFALKNLIDSHIKTL